MSFKLTVSTQVGHDAGFEKFDPMKIDMNRSTSVPETGPNPMLRGKTITEYEYDDFKDSLWKSTLPADLIELEGHGRRKTPFDGKADLNDMQSWEARSRELFPPKAPSPVLLTPKESPVSPPQESILVSKIEIEKMRANAIEEKPSSSRIDLKGRGKGYKSSGRSTPSRQLTGTDALKRLEGLGIPILKPM